MKYIFFVFLFCGLLIYRGHLLMQDAAAIKYYDLLIIFNGLMLAISIFFYKNILNPISIISVFGLAFAYYFLYLSKNQERLSTETIYCITLFLIFYYLGTLIRVKKANPKILDLTTINPKFHYYITNFFLVAGTIVASIEFVITGGIPLFLSIVKNQNIYGKVFLIPFLHNFVMFLALLPSIYYVLLTKKILSKKRFYVYTLLVIFILLNFLSRQILILGVLFYFFTFVKVKKLNINKLLIRFSIVSSFLFILIGNLRISNMNKDIDPNDYLKIYSNIHKDIETVILETTFNLYATQNINTLNEFIEKTKNYDYGKNVSKPLIKLFFLDKVEVFDYDPEFDSFKELATIVAEPYLDFGVLGVIFFAFFYGIIAKISYIKYHYGETMSSIINYATIIFCIFMGVFTNFFNIFFIWFIFIVSNVVFKTLYYSNNFNNNDKNINVKRGNKVHFKNDII